MRSLFFLALLLAAGPAIAAQPAALTPAQMHQFDGLHVGEQMVVGGFPDGFGGDTALEFTRIDVYAPGARVIAVDAAGEHALPRSQRIHLIGTNAAGDVRASLSYGKDFTDARGVGSNPSGAFAITSERDASGIRLRMLRSDATLPAGVVPEVIPGDDAIQSGLPLPDALSLKLTSSMSSMASTSATTAALHLATVAVDTDNELMSLRFGNNTTNATNWIADLFAAMNVMYQRDLGVQLQQGTTYLRTSADPWASTTSAAADTPQLNEFGNYWAAHYAAVSRTFAMLLSGKSTSQNSASGIAWINAYCSTQYGYSVTRVFTNAQIGVSYSALVVGHELGHNFGASHTHCTNASTGAAPTGTNTIDKCYNGESGSGCYSGPTSCPTSGPGAPAGSVMSYCNMSGCGSNGQNVLQFHPTQIATLSALVTQNTPTCLAPVSTDIIFVNGFQ